MKRISTILFISALYSSSVFAAGEVNMLLSPKGKILTISIESDSTSDEDTLSALRNWAARKKTLLFLDKSTFKKHLTNSTDTLPTTEWLFFKNPEGTFMDKFIFSGNVRFLTIYRNMSEYYPDLVTANKNISFSDYPTVNVAASNNGNAPMLELGMELPVSNNLSFKVGYSYANNFKGLDGNNSTSTASSRSNMYFSGNLKSENFALSIDAGQVLWARLSKFTMGQPIYRDNYFDRVAWDWYRNSFQRYNDYYAYSNNVGPEGFGRSPVQGVVLNADFKKIKTGVTGVFGRTNRNLIQSNATSHYPSLTYAVRVNRGIITNFLTSTVGLNYYKRQADTDPVQGIKDNVQFGSFDFDAKRREFRLSGEIGLGKIETPTSTKNAGLAIDVKTEVFDNVLPFTLGVEYYDIDINAVTLDGSIINSNKALKDGGYGNELNWDNMLYINVAQEVDQIANNRRGLILKAKKTIGKFKIDLGYSMSQEKQNLYDTITIQHRVNAFSRSRFRPWYQAGGPYSRIKSNWMRTFETLTITDAANGVSTDYLKGFNSIELLLKFKSNLFNREIILLNMSNFNSIQDNFSLLPQSQSKAFVNTLYNDFTIAYALGRSYMVVGNAGIEKIYGGERIDLSPENGKTINQTGYGVGLGVDYDFNKQANLHLRHRWMFQQDENFVLDKFRGQETYFELKILF